MTAQFWTDPAVARALTRRIAAGRVIQRAALLGGLHREPGQAGLVSACELAASGLRRAGAERVELLSFAVGSSA